MATNTQEAQKNYGSSNRYIFGLIADYEAVVGFLLAGIGEYIDSAKKKRNYMMVSEETPAEEIEAFFRTLCDTKSVAVILIATEAYELIRSIIEQRQKAIPIIIEMPSRKMLENVTF